MLLPCWCTVFADAELRGATEDADGAPRGTAVAAHAPALVSIVAVFSSCESSTPCLRSLVRTRSHGLEVNSFILTSAPNATN